MITRYYGIRYRNGSPVQGWERYEPPAVIASRLAPICRRRPAEGVQADGGQGGGAPPAAPQQPAEELDKQPAQDAKIKSAKTNIKPVFLSSLLES
jgi:hypothetical protein